MKWKPKTDRHQLAMTFKEIADVLGVSISRVGQIEAKAIRKLRKAAKERGIEWSPSR